MGLDLWVILGAIVMLIVANTLYQRQKERNLIQRLKNSDNNASLAIGELDREIEQNRETAEYWKRQSGRRL